MNEMRNITIWKDCTSCIL